jgi:SHOCT-like domain
MNEDRKRILAMLAEGKVTADEAERLLDAMSRTPAPVTAGPAPQTPGSNNAPRYLRVEVDADDAREGKTKVNIRVPMQLLRAGVRLSALIPPRARDEVNAAMKREGIPFDINQLKPENLEELIEHMSDMTVDVDNERAKVRVYCE